MKLIWNPWKKIKELERYVDRLEAQVMDANYDADLMLDVLNQIAMVAGPRSNVTVRRMSKMAQDAVDEVCGYEVDEE